jgi:helicase
MLVCTPTASGKTLIAELAALKSIIEGSGKAIYIVPLKALANEKYKDFKKRYDGIAKVALSIGDIDSTDSYLIDYDLIITTSEKLDSLIRHHAPWLSLISTIIIDEIHLLNDAGRGPTLEILITILRQLLKKAQIIGLSATIGNPEELSEWLKAELVIDNWRPVKLHKGVYLNGEVEFE